WASRAGPGWVVLFHLAETGWGNPGTRQIANQRHHAVAMPAEHEGGDILDRDVDLVGEKKTKTRAVKHARHADDHLLGQAAGLLQCPDHGVERVGDAD